MKSWISRLRASSLALDVQDELSLSYIHGKQPHLLALQPHGRHFNAITQILIFFRFLYKRFKFLPRAIQPSKYLAYAGTANQSRALQSSIDALRNRGSVLVLYDTHLTLDRQPHGSAQLTFNFSDVLIAITLLLTRGLRLYCGLKKSPQGIHNYFHVFLQAYAYIPVFLRTLETICPTHVIQSNDHSVSNRALNLVARSLGITTVYMQHASVSPFFPPLDVDIALLDGEIGLQNYINCEHAAQVEGNGIPFRPVKIYLTGQKKELVNFKSRAFSKSVGIATNPLDEIDRVIELLDLLRGTEAHIVLRTHPRQAATFVKALQAYCSQNSHVTHQQSADTPLHIFFGGIGYLIAGNSSIHLEAALSHVQSYQYNFTRQPETDYYGYIRNGITSLLPIERIIEGTLTYATLCSRAADVDKAIRRYSATFGTKWEGREGELVAVTIADCTQVQAAEMYCSFESEIDRLQCYQLN